MRSSSAPMRRVGVLDLQGCVDPHRAHFDALGVAMYSVRDVRELAAVDALVLPGGESTTMLRLIAAFGMESALRDQLRNKPVWGICAGAILIASEVVGPRPQRCLALMDFAVQRNGYGRQLQSSHATVAGYRVSFIRAPRICRVGPGVRVVERQGQEPVWLQSGITMATTFHPELTLDPPSPMHRAFVSISERS